MNRELKRVSGLIVLMFAALFVASSVIQVFQSTNLGSDPRNARARADVNRIQRGQILLSDGTVIATSKTSNDEYDFLRTYTQPETYAAVTGYDPVDGEATGIEAALNSQLAGTGSSTVFSHIQSIISGQEPKGDSVQLTIDPKAQQAAYKALGNYTGAVVALDPKTGAILAMVSKPSYDPNLLASHDQSKVTRAFAALQARNPSPLFNRALQDLNPPASTFKLVVASAALESGKYTANSTFPSPLTLTLPGTSFQISNSGGEACGSGTRASIATAIKYSCNIPFAQLGDALGEKAIGAMAAKYGFGQSLSVPLKAATSVYPSGMTPSELAQSAFGQYDDKATVLQMAMVSSAIANGGVLEKPQMVQKVISPSLDTVSQLTPVQFSQPISQATAASVTNMMVAGVNATGGGAATNASISGVPVAGKTGTAQNAPGAPYTLWFTGFAPANDPRVAVAVVIENGGGLGQQGYGNLLAAPIAKKVMEAILAK